MVKPALGKGMKDLLPKTLKIGKEKKDDETSLHEELKVTIERYRAQGFDVSVLKDLENKPIKKIRKGIDDYRNALKKLNSAMTVLKSLEGYGYTKEIESIVENIKNPEMAEKVFQDAEGLKERAFAEHNIKHEKAEDTPGARVMKSLQARYKVINDVVGKEEEALEEDVVDEEETVEEINTEDLDALLTSMDGLGDDLDLTLDDLGSESPVEEPGEIPADEEPTPAEEPVPEPEPAPEPEDPSVPEEIAEPAAEEIPDTTQEPVEMPVEEPIPAPEAEIVEPLVEEPVPVTSEEPVPEPEPEPIPEEPAFAEEPPASEGSVNVELLMEKAKDMYRTGDMLDSLSTFEELLKHDPDNSKAKFMIRRIKQKLQ